MTALEFRACDACRLATEFCDGCKRNERTIDELRAALRDLKQSLDYDLSDLPLDEHALTGAAGRLWQTNMSAWKIASQALRG